MKAVVQRVSRASVVCRPEPDPSAVRAIGPGLLVLAGVEEGDGPGDRDWLAEKLVHLRIFADEQGKMNRSVLDVGGSILLISNFTVAGDARKGRRPSFDNAMRPPEAKEAFEALLRTVAELAGANPSVQVRTGVFAADMQVSLVNDGPITLWLDSRAR